MKHEIITGFKHMSETRKVSLSLNLDISDIFVVLEVLFDHTFTRKYLKDQCQKQNDDKIIKILFRGILRYYKYITSIYHLCFYFALSSNVYS